jgi:hypothetical protein
MVLFHRLRIDDAANSVRARRSVDPWMHQEHTKDVPYDQQLNIKGGRIQRLSFCFRKIYNPHNREQSSRKGGRDTNVQVRILPGAIARTKQLSNDDVLVGRRTSPLFLRRGRKIYIGPNEK